MRITLTFTRPYPKHILAESRNSGLSTFLVSWEESKKQAAPNERIILIFPSPETEYIELDSIKKPTPHPDLPNSQNINQYPQLIDTTDTQRFWEVTYNQGGVSFYMPYKDHMYSINIDITAGTISKFECYKDGYTVVSDSNLFAEY